MSTCKVTNLNNLILQWGTYTQHTAQTVYYPVVFTLFYGKHVSFTDSNSTTQSRLLASDGYNSTTSGFNAPSSGGSYKMYYFAYGTK